ICFCFCFVSTENGTKYINFCRYQSPIPFLYFLLIFTGSFLWVGFLFIKIFPTAFCIYGSFWYLIRMFFVLFTGRLFKVYGFENKTLMVRFPANLATKLLISLLSIM